MIRLDQSDASTLALCQTCGWRAIRRSRLAAWEAGASHQRAAHPEDSRNAVKAASKIRQRSSNLI